MDEHEFKLGDIVEVLRGTTRLHVGNKYIITTLGSINVVLESIYHDTMDVTRLDNIRLSSNNIIKRPFNPNDIQLGDLVCITRPEDADKGNIAWDKYRDSLDNCRAIVTSIETDSQHGVFIRTTISELWFYLKYNGFIKLANKGEFTEYDVEMKGRVLKPKETKGKKLFKYLPVFYNGLSGIYDKEKKILLFPKAEYLQELSILIGNDIPKNIEDYYCPDVLTTFCKFRVINYKTSGKIFSNSNKKAELLGKFVNVSKFEFEIEHPKSEVPVNTLYVNTENSGNLRMVLDDIQIIYPNIRGYTPKKDRDLFKVNREGQIISINVVQGEKLMLINNKHVKNCEHKDVIIVKEIKPIGNNVFIGFIGKFNVTNDLDYVNIKNFKKLEGYVSTEKKTVKKEIGKSGRGILEQISQPKRQWSVATKRFETVFKEA